MQSIERPYCIFNLHYDPTAGAGARCINSYGITTVHRTGVGVYTITCTQPDALAALVWDAAGTLSNRVCAQQTGVGAYTVRTYNDGGAGADAAADCEFWFVGWRNPPSPDCVDTSV